MERFSKEGDACCFERLARLFLEFPSRFLLASLSRFREAKKIPVPIKLAGRWQKKGRGAAVCSVVEAAAR